MVDQVFLANDLSAGPVLFGGLRINVLSIWHSWALSASDNAFALHKDWEFEDLCQAVMICTLTRDRYQELEHNNALAIYLGEVSAHIIDLDSETRKGDIHKFAEYFEECTCIPEWWDKGGSDPRARIRAPIEWQVVAVLLRMKICRTELEAWNYPFAKSFCWIAVDREAEGNQKYIDQKDRDGLALLNAQQMEINNATNQE